VEQWWPDREAEEQATERSRAMEREAAARAFDDPFWPIARVLRWLAWRDPALIEEPWGPMLRYVNMAFRGNPRPKLLRALQQAELRAIKDGKELAPEFCCPNGSRPGRPPRWRTSDPSLKRDRTSATPRRPTRNNASAVVR
jgi:hypothetical protein